MAQQGSPPRRPGRHSAPDPGSGPHDREPYDDQRGTGPQNADPYAADPYATGPRGSDPRGGPPHGAPDDPYAARGLRDDPYGPRDPYGADPRAADPYADLYRTRQAAAPQQAPPRPAPAPPAAPARRPEPQRAPVPAAPGPARRAASRPGAQPGRVAPWQQDDPFTAGDEEDDLPPWAGLTIRPARAAGPKARPGREAEPEAAPAQADPAAPPRRRGLRRGRAAAARLRKSRRRVYVYCGTAIVVAVAVAGYLALDALPKHTPAPTFITTLQPGEFATVPGACRSVSPALLASYLPGQVTTVSPAGTSASYSQCSLTVDRKPVFRVLEVTSQAYQPSAVAAGNGSATANAVDSFVIAEQTLRAPGKKSALPPAQLTPITGLGTEAFRGVQVVHINTAVNDLVTVMARQRNLVVTVILQAQASGNGYGPVDEGTIEAGALAVARAVLAHDTAAAKPGLTWSSRAVGWSTVLLLAFDTATPAVTVALHDGDQIVAAQSAVDARRQGELLAPFIEAALRAAGAGRRDLTAIAVGTGPGPYTGLRAGLITARVLGDALRLPVDGICTLDIIAAAVDPPGGEFLVATDARRKELYWARYSAAGERLDGPHVCPASDLAAGLPVAGEGAVLYPELGAEPIGARYPDAACLAALSAKRIAAGTPAAPAEPLYLRRPDAREPGQRKRVTP